MFPVADNMGVDILGAFYAGMIQGDFLGFFRCQRARFFGTAHQNQGQQQKKGNESFHKYVSL
jgi:hypothetical protein